ncbi:MAG: rRNA maturation RNAse YbeY, partial [Pseudomonadota bacterium]
MTIATDVHLTLEISVDEALSSTPDVARWQDAADAALAVATADGDQRAWAHAVSVNVVSSVDSQALNADWRDKHKPTNVLAFPMPEM